MLLSDRCAGAQAGASLTLRWRSDVLLGKWHVVPWDQVWGPWDRVHSFSPLLYLPQLRLCNCPGEYKGLPFALEMKSKDAPKQKTHLYCNLIYGHFQAMTVHTFDCPESVRQSLASIALARASNMPGPAPAAPPCPPTAMQATVHSMKTQDTGAAAFSVQAVGPGVRVTKRPDPSSRIFSCLLGRP